MKIYFLNCYEQKSPPIFPEVALCICWGMPSVLGVLQAFLALIPACVKPLVQQEVRDHDLFRSLGGMYITLHIHMAFYIPRYMVEFFKVPIDITYSRFFFQNFWLASCLPQLVLLPQLAIMLNNCCWLFSTNALG